MKRRRFFKTILAAGAILGIPGCRENVQGSSNRIAGPVMLYEQKEIRRAESKIMSRRLHGYIVGGKILNEQIEEFCPEGRVFNSELVSVCTLIHEQHRTQCYLGQTIDDVIAKMNR